MANPNYLEYDGFNMISNEELTKVVMSYKEGLLPKPLFHECLARIAKQVFESKHYKFECSADECQRIISDAADLCIVKSEKFDPERGKAFNFFTTIIGCWLRQERAIMKQNSKGLC